jgi:alpha-tubulin suppressor-like RCC1 family protein
MDRSGGWRKVLAGAGLAVAAGAATAVPAAAAHAATPAHVPGVYGFGWNANGQLGNGTLSKQTMGLVSGLPGTVKQVAAGTNLSAALLPDGTVQWWGNIFSLGNLTAPHQVPGLSGITQVAVSRDSGDLFAVGPGGQVWASGYNQHGELGNGSTTSRVFGFAVVPGLTGITQVAAGSGYALALRSDGTVWAWGLNANGQLGDGTKTDHLTPEQVPGLSGITQVAADAYESFAVRSDGTVLDWGYGYLGDGTGIRSVTGPQPVPGLGGVRQVASGEWNAGHTLALRFDGTVMAWGENESGEVGDGTTSARLSPVQLPLSSVTQVAADQTESAAVRSDGTLLTWGEGTYGELGRVPAVAVSPVPLPADGLTWVTQVALGDDYTLAVSTAPAGYVPVPNVVGDTQAQASQALSAAGLFLGAVTTRADLTCDSIGLVLSQGQAAGSYVSHGTPVSVTIGKLPPKCS